MDSPTGMIPEDLMYPSKLPDVITFLNGQPLLPHVKRDYLVAWSKTVGARLTFLDIAQVETITTNPKG